MLADLTGAPVSIDTSKAAVARRALELGVELVNDVTALRGDPDLAGVVADGGSYLCLMHMHGEPRTMQDDPRYDDVVADVKASSRSGSPSPSPPASTRSCVCLDPGIGFGKTSTHNFELVRRLDELCALGRPVLVGFSRKSSLAALTGDAGRSARPPPRSARPSPPTTAARRSSASTTCASTSRRWPRRRPSRMIVELQGLEVFGRHGAYPEEQRDGQLFLFDVQLEVGERGANDRLEDAVDYRRSRAAMRELSAARRFDLLEALATATADLLFERFRRSGSASACASGRPACRRAQRGDGRSGRDPAYVGLGSNLGDREATIRRAPS